MQFKSKQMKNELIITIRMQLRNPVTVHRVNSNKQKIKETRQQINERRGYGGASTFPFKLKTIKIKLIKKTRTLVA